jgi:hypothetical protein
VALEKAVILNTHTGKLIPVMFNPEEYVFSKENNFAQMAVPGLRGPLVQFVNGNQKTLQMELLVDTYEAHDLAGQQMNHAGQDVRDFTSQITQLMDIDPDLHAPPVLQFVPGDWGPRGSSSSILPLTCVLAKVSERFVLFLRSGIPVRARLQATFVEYLDPELAAQEIKTQTADYTQLHAVLQGETLTDIAGRLYHDPALWRPIALRNQIDDPRAMAIGVQLVIPQLPFRNPETGEVIA